ncbi:peptidase [Nitrosopumilus sp.]|nr:peptidase [Nitrosopumilus sp.]
MKTSSIPFRILKSKYFLLALGLFVCLSAMPQSSFGEVFIPSHEYVSYFDSNGIYTVVGNVKNDLDYAIIPTITVSVENNSKIFSKTIQHVPLASGTEIPFKIKFFEQLNNPILLPAELSFEKTLEEELPIAILYDETLITYDDGHLTGRIQNNGDTTIYNPKVFAVIHGYEKVLDVGQNMDMIEKIDPGEIVDFSMYPDPSITDDVYYYSCFGTMDTTVVPGTAKKSGGDFDFRYDSPGTWYHDPVFDDTDTKMSIIGYNSFPLEGYANFEFYPISGEEKFDVRLDGEPVKFLQSMDEMGSWHVVFNIDPLTQGTWEISGFEQGLPSDMPKVPMWIKQNGGWWSNDQIVDSEFLEGIKFLIEKQIIEIPTLELSSQNDSKIPTWTKTIVGWWNEEQLSDDEFLSIIKNLVEREIIVV